MTSNVDSTDNRNKSNEKTMFADSSQLTSAEDPDDRQVPKQDDEQTFVQLPLLTTDESSRRNLSFSSSSSKTSDPPEICRICHCEGTNDEPLISPCLCLGTVQYLHQTCLQRWIKSAGVKSCELCKFEFIMHSEIKPFKQVFFVVKKKRNERKIWRSFLVAKVGHEYRGETQSDVFSRVQFDRGDVCSLVPLRSDRKNARRSQNGQTTYANVSLWRRSSMIDCYRL